MSRCNPLLCPCVEQTMSASKYGIRLPAPKLDLPSHFRDEESLLLWYSRIPHIWEDAWTPAHKALKSALLEYCRAWRIERSRADDLEQMVERLEAEVRMLRKPSVWARIGLFLSPRRATNVDQ
jgi:hypothetical protein